MNMIMVNMGAGAPTSYADYEGSLTIGGTVVLNQNDFNKYANSFGTPDDQTYSGYDGTNVMLHAYGQAVAMGAPIFQSSAAQEINGPMSISYGTALSDGYSCIYSNIDFATNNKSPANPLCFQGDYITLYFMGMGIALEYYH